MNKLYPLSLFTLLLGLTLVVLGPLIQFRQGLPLACPEWPLCFGTPEPHLASKAWIEYAHRFVATLVGLCSLTLLFGVYRFKDSFSVETRKAAAYAAFYVIIQGILGGLTVLYRLPMVISTLHMFFSLFYLYFQLKLTFGLRPLREIEEGEQSFLAKQWNPHWRDSVWLTSSLMVFVIVLGSFVRQTGSLPVCGTGWSSLWSCHALWVDEVSGRSQLHLFFRFSALVLVLSLLVGFYAKWTWWREHRSSPYASRLFAPYLLWLGLGIFQFCAGLMVLVTHISLEWSIFYLGLSMGFLLWSWHLALTYSSYAEYAQSSKHHTLASDLLELTKPRLSALVVVTATVGMILAPLPMGLMKALLALLLITLVVMGACALNCVLEKDIDKRMERTKDRTLPSGRMSAQSAMVFGGGLLLLSVPLLGFFINWLTAGLAGLAALLYLYAYTPMKQKSELALYVGAIPGALPPVMGWTAVMNSIEPMPIILFIIMFIWQLPHFMAISVFHREDYEKAGIKVYPSKQGFDFTRMGIFVYTLALLFAALLPHWWAGSSREYFASALFFSIAFLGIAAVGFKLGQEEEPRRLWARKYFLGSIFYLPLIMGSLIVFR